MVKDLKELKSYPYCGHGALLGKVKNDWQDSEYVLNLFGTSLGSARRAYGAFVAKGVAKGRRPDLVCGGLLRSVERKYPHQSAYSAVLPRSSQADDQLCGCCPQVENQSCHGKPGRVPSNEVAKA